MNETTVTEQDQTQDESVALAVKAVERLFDQGSSNGDIYEPQDDRTARAAVSRLGELFMELPKTIVEALDGARSSGELLSSDRLQGLAEILQNADDASASEVRLVLREDDLLVGHNGRAVRLRHVVGLATPWFSTKGGEAGSLGRHGIGLSALRSLSRTIEVHCSPYHLRLGDPNLSPIGPMKLPGALDEGEWTVFRIPIGDGSIGVEELADWLDRWGDAGLLFLRNTEAVELRESGGEMVRRLSVRRTATVPDVSDASPGAEIHRQCPLCQHARDTGAPWN